MTPAVAFFRLFGVDPLISMGRWIHLAFMVNAVIYTVLGYILIKVREHRNIA